MIARIRAWITQLEALWERLQPTLPVRAWNRYGDLRGDRLAGAASFYGFVSLFPLLVLSAAIASQVAGSSGLETVQTLVDDNFPDLGIKVSDFHRRAGTLGLISAVVLLYSGLRWVDAVRAAVRSMWGMDDQPGNFFVRKLLDIASLAGLGLLIASSWGATVIIRRMTRQMLDWIGVEGAGAEPVLAATGWLLSIGLNTLLFAYLLAGLPRIGVPGKQQVLTALLGALLFEVLKTFLVEFVIGPVSDNRYATFAAPLAVMMWIYVVTRLLMVLAAVTAESAIDQLEEEELAEIDAGAADLVDAQEPGAAVAGDGAPTRPAGGVRVVVTPTAGQARTMGVAAGAVLGAAGAGLLVLTGRAFRAARSALRRESADGS